jgi:hypothetical protein
VPPLPLPSLSTVNPPFSSGSFTIAGRHPDPGVGFSLLLPRLFAFSASWLLGSLASWLLGFLAFWLFGFLEDTIPGSPVQANSGEMGMDKERHKPRLGDHASRLIRACQGMSLRQSDGRLEEKVRNKL